MLDNGFSFQFVFLRSSWGTRYRIDSRLGFRFQMPQATKKTVMTRMTISQRTMLKVTGKSLYQSISRFRWLCYKQEIKVVCYKSYCSMHILIKFMFFFYRKLVYLLLVQKTYLSTACKGYLWLVTQSLMMKVLFCSWKGKVNQT